MRCRACYQHGHNRASCPTEKARIESLRSTYGDDHYAVSNYDRKKESRKVRTCSYCSNSDHNRRNCEVLASDRTRLIAVQASFRARYINALCKTGFIPGTVVKHSFDGYVSRKQANVEGTFLILAPYYSMINFNGFGAFSMKSKFLGGDLSVLEDRPWRLQSCKNYQVVPPFGNSITYNLNSDYRAFERQYFDIVLAEGCEQTFRNSIPQSFLDGTDNIDEFFASGNRNSIGKDHDSFLSSIEGYENSNRFNWLEENSLSYCEATSDLEKFEATILAQQARFDW